MVKTGLPYKMEEMDDICNNGAIVDMSSIKFPGIDESDQVRTSFVFLRNTGFDNVTLDFSTTSYDIKSNFVKEFITSDIVIEYKGLAATLINLLSHMSNLPFRENNSIFNENELNKFVKENKELLSEVLQILVSLPLYAMNRLSLKDKLYSMDDVEHTDKFIVKNNLKHLFGYNAIPFIISSHQEIKPLYYDLLFREDNNELFEAFCEGKTMIPEMLYGMGVIDSNVWQGFSKTSLQ